MSDVWPTARLGDVCQTGAGGTPLSSKKEYYEGGTIPWLVSGEVAQGEITSSTNFITALGLENSSARIFPEDTVLVAMYGATAGQVGILRFKAATNQAICGILPNDTFAPQFMYYLLLSKKQELISQAAGNAQPNISQIKIKNTRVPIPSLPEQQRIVAILDEAFAGLATTIANAEKNLKSARELFENYLNSVFEEDKDWEETTLGAIAAFKNGLNFTKSSKGEKVRIVGVGDFQNNFWVPTKDLNSVQIDGGISEPYLLRKGDILTVRSNGNKQLIGRCVLASDVPEKTSHSGFTIRIRITRPDVDPVYLVRYLKSGRARKALIESGDGAQISNLNQQALTALPIKLLDKEGQRDVVDRAAEMETEADRLEELYERRVGHLQELRQSILQKAFSGELTSSPSFATKEAAE